MRRAHIERQTAETSISATWELDSPGNADISTGIGFLDHMLSALAVHSNTALMLRCSGDLEVDTHHSTEDVGIVLGQALNQALGERRGIERFGHMACPLDEALVMATVDLSGRPGLVYDLRPAAPSLGAWERESIRELFAALVDHGRITLHLHQVCGDNSHHIVEAAFKALARALRQAIAVTGSGIPSTKGSLV